MSHYEARLERDLEEIRGLIRYVGGDLERSLRASVESLLTQNRELAGETAIRDQIINRQILRLDRMCHSFVARHLPGARHLRFVSAVLRANISLERIGDYTVTICREAAQVEGIPSELRREIGLRAEEAGHILHHSLVAFEAGNGDLARATRKMVAGMARAYDGMLISLIRASESREVQLRDAFSLLLVMNRLSRVCDQAKNLCEEAVFTATGERKRGKNFRILLMGAAGSGRVKPACELAAAAFGDRGRITGAEISGKSSEEPVKPTEALLAADVLILLDQGLRARIGRIPYHAVLVDWSSDDSSEDWQELLGKRLAELTDVIIGSNASIPRPGI